MQIDKDVTVKNRQYRIVINIEVVRDYGTNKEIKVKNIHTQNICFRQFLKDVEFELTKGR